MLSPTGVGVDDNLDLRTINDQQRKRAHLRFARVAGTGLLLAGAAVATGLSRYHPVPLAIGIALALSCAGFGFVVAARVLAPWRGFDLEELVIGWLVCLMWAVVGTLLGVPLIVDGRDGLVATELYIAAALLLASIVIPFWMTARPRRAVDLPREWESLEERAEWLKHVTRYQLSFSRSVSASISLDSKLFSGEVSREQGQSEERLPLTLPEIVQLFRGFATRVGSERGRVLICIDELDKLALVEEVEKFLNDVKAIFDIPGCCFVISVSEDALASFERRGLPTRTAIDSAFDDVIRLGYLDWSSAQRVLTSRVARVPPMLWGLCFVLAGGLPRDLVRVARLMFQLRESDDALGELARRMVVSDLRDRALGTLQAFRSLPTTEVSDAAVDWVDASESLDGRSAALLAHAGSAKAAALELWVATEGRLLAASGLIRDLAAHLYFLGTIVEVFTGDLSHPLIDCLRGAGRSSAALDQLAQIRRHAMLGPSASWASNDRFRQDWDLARVARPW